MLTSQLFLLSLLLFDLLISLTSMTVAVLHLLAVPRGRLPLFVCFLAADSPVGDPAYPPQARQPHHQRLDPMFRPPDLPSGPMEPVPCPLWDTPVIHDARVAALDGGVREGARLWAEEMTHWISSVNLRSRRLPFANSVKLPPLLQLPMMRIIIVRRVKLHDATRRASNFPPDCQRTPYEAQRLLVWRSCK